MRGESRCSCRRTCGELPRPLLPGVRAVGLSEYRLPWLPCDLRELSDERASKYGDVSDGVLHAELNRPGERVWIVNVEESGAAERVAGRGHNVLG